MAEPWSSESRGPTAHPADADLDTIALLQEEIAHLEGEIRMRDDAAASASEDLQATRRRPDIPDTDAKERLDALNAALADREETIALLLDHLRLGEEAEAASRAEWEQLNSWVQEVERRVEGHAGSATDAGLRDALDAERRSTEALRQAADKERRTAEAQRHALVDEVERLRSKFAEIASESGAGVDAVRALERENDELRDAYDGLVRDAVPSHEVDAIVAELQAVRLERDNAGHDLKRAIDAQHRERNEHEAALNALQSQLARESLRRQEDHVKAATLPAAETSALDPDVRIRALREHLNEIHQDEAQQRMRRSLSSRLSRLWHHTGPVH